MRFSWSGGCTSHFLLGNSRMIFPRGLVAWSTHTAVMPIDGMTRFWPFLRTPVSTIFPPSAVKTLKVQFSPRAKIRFSLAAACVVAASSMAKAAMRVFDVLIWNCLPMFECNASATLQLSMLYTIIYILSSIYCINPLLSMFILIY